MDVDEEGNGEAEDEATLAENESEKTIDEPVEESPATNTSNVPFTVNDIEGTGPSNADFDSSFFGDDSG